MCERERDLFTLKILHFSLDYPINSKHGTHVNTTDTVYFLVKVKKNQLLFMVPNRTCKERFLSCIDIDIDKHSSYGQKNSPKITLYGNTLTTCDEVKHFVENVDLTTCDEVKHFVENVDLTTCNEVKHFVENVNLTTCNDVKHFVENVDLTFVR